ncbi:MAG: hypothetical protein JKY37_22940 [Nannocystaceae bacterium]|nr:hypothetical protein [Nannocystaceae bacterium]
MGVFSPEDCNRLDFEVLAEGGVALYYQHEVLGEDVAWFALEGYEVVQFDDGAMDSLEAFHFEARLKLSPDREYDPSFDGFREATSRLQVPDPGGVALVFTNVDKLAEADPISTLRLFDVVADLSREFLLFGRRLVALAQTDAPDLDLGPIGGRTLTWNPRERAGWTRGL